MKNILFIPYCLVLSLLFICAHTAQGQGWVRWNTYNNIAEMVPHPDGGLLIAATKIIDIGLTTQVVVAHINDAGEIVSEQAVMDSVYASDLVVGENGLPTLMVYKRSIRAYILIPINWDGQSTGSAFQTPDVAGAKTQISPFPGGGFVGGFVSQANLFVPPAVLNLRRLDTNGNKVWETFIDSLPSGYSLSAYGISTNALGQTIVGFKTGTPQNPKYHLSIVDADGNLLWNRTDIVPTMVGVTSDEQFFYITFEADTINDYVLYKVNASGAILWEQKQHQLDASLAPGDYSINAAGGLVLGGNGFALGSNQLILLRSLDSLGNTIKEINRPLPGFSGNSLSVHHFTQGSDGYFYFYGDAFDFGNGITRYFILKMDADGNIYAQRILGTLGYDADKNCLLEAGEQGLEGHKVKIEDLVSGTVFYASSDTLGQFVAETDSTQFVVSTLLSNPYWKSCQGDSLVSFGANQDTVRVDFPLQKVVDCSFLEVSIATPFLRRCFDNTYYVRYCNTGTIDAEQAYVDVTLDPYLSFLSSSIPGVNIGNQRYRFQVGNVPFGYCGSFTLQAHLDCDSTILGQSHCVEAHIYPDSFCLQSGAWSGANVRVNGICQPDSVQLVVKNTGTAPNSVPLEYVIIEDNIIFRSGSFQLPAQDSLIIKVPSNGSTWRIEAEQEPFSPGDPMPSAVVEGCGQNENGSFSIGFVSQFGENDGNPYVSTDCQESRGAYDPNDKQGFPKGVGDEHWIEPGTELDYMIRFQNTGTDTAFTVVVRDTLAEWLDPGSVRTGASSNPYSFQLSGKGILRFTFNSIALPDSNTNLAGSQGFLKFKVKVRPDVPLNTLIKNQAAIYFDFNAPVLTNTTVHKIGKDFLPLTTYKPNKIVPELEVFPNPAVDQTYVTIKGLRTKQGRLELSDIQGRVVLQQNFSGDRCLLNAGKLPSGLYFLRAYDGDTWIGNGKIVFSGR
ncbi:MAG: T9SS type A sorting domain-containing protein [Bacteroidota bacterium]